MRLFTLRVDDERLEELAKISKAYGISAGAFVRKAIDDQLARVGIVEKQSATVPMSAIEEIARIAAVREPVGAFDGLPALSLSRRDYAERLRQCKAVAARYLGDGPELSIKTSVSVSVLGDSLMIAIEGKAVGEAFTTEAAHVAIGSDAVTISFSNPIGPLYRARQQGLAAVVEVISKAAFPHPLVNPKVVPFTETGDEIRIDRDALATVGVNLAYWQQQEAF